MLDNAVRYLRDAGVPFRVFSYASPEPLPRVAHPVPRGGLLLAVRVVIVAGRASLACMAADDTIGWTGLANALDASVVGGDTADLPSAFRNIQPPLPPFGGLFGVPLFADDSVPAHATLVFPAFAASDFVELAYEDFARLERPRVAPVAAHGELPP
jgi:Ala-tRNA(Pro) deacylase